MKIAFLLPGQGSQEPEMLKALPQNHLVKKTIQEASETLNECAYNFHTKEALKATKAVQLSLLISGVAAFRLFESEGIKPDFVAGHSIGAFAAAVAAEVIDFQDAIRIVKLRGELMESIRPKGYGMAVILGMDISHLQAIIDHTFEEKQPVYLSNINAPGQITISGSIKGLEKVMKNALENGAQCASLLNVSTPSHCLLLLPVSEKLEEALSHIAVNRPKIPYAGNRSARLLIDPMEIRNDLAQSVAASVRWHDATSVLYEKGVRTFIEMPPGNVLTRLANHAFDECRVLSVAENGFEDCMYVANRKV